MNSYLLRVNYNHLKGEINHDYLAMKDHLTRSLIGSLAIIHSTVKRLDSLVMEDNSYNHILRTAMSVGTNQDLFKLLDLSSNVYETLDMHTFVEEFMLSKYKPNKTCYLLVTIDSGYYLNVTLKDL